MTYKVTAKNDKISINVTTTDNNVNIVSPNHSVSLSRTGGQGAKGDSITDVYVTEGILYVEVSNSAGDVVDTINAGDFSEIIRANIVVGNLSDVTISGLSTDQILRYNSVSGDWENYSLTDDFYTETEVDSLLSGKSDVGHTHDDRYYTETEVNSLLAGKENADATILKDADIGVTVQAYDATLLNDADIGVTVQGYDATILKDADIGVTVQGYDATILKDADIGSTVQAYDAGLTSIAGLPTIADKMLYTTGTDTWSTTSLTSYIRTLLDDPDAVTARSTLGLVIGADVQAYDPNNVVDADYVHTDNNFTDSLRSKLIGVESGATADQIASEVPFLNTDSGLIATDVQEAIDEVVVLIESTTLGDLSDVADTASITGETVMFDSTSHTWVTRKATTNDISDIDNTNKADGAVLVYSSTSQKYESNVYLQGGSF